MQADRKGQALRVFAAVAALTFLAGCRIPGASFGNEPLQLRFAAVTRSAIQADELSTGRAPDPVRATPAKRMLVVRHD